MGPAHDTFTLLAEEAVVQLAHARGWKVYVWARDMRPVVKLATHIPKTLWASFEIRGRKVERLVKFEIAQRLDGELVFQAVV